MTQSRHPAGLPNGGQFAPSSTTRADVHLDTSASPLADDPAIQALAEAITGATGYEPLSDEDAADFAVSATEPCMRCGTITATATLAIDDDGIPERLCRRCAFAPDLPR